MVKAIIFNIEKNIIFSETFLWSFYGQSFIKTVRGPLNKLGTGLLGHATNQISKL